MTLKCITKRVGELLFLEVDDVLQDVIAKRILNKVEGASGDLANKLRFLRTSGMIYTALQDAATMTVGPNCNAIGSDGIENEL